MKVRILGSGTSTGVPVIGCSCQICRSGKSRNRRSRASIALTTDDRNWIVVDTGPDFRQQVLDAGITSLAAVLYTHIHADHVHGFDDLRAFYFHDRRPMDCWLLPGYVEEFRRRFAYAFEETGYHGTPPVVRLHRIPEAAFPVNGLMVDPLVLPHGHVLSCAFRIQNFAYATDFKRFSDEQIQAWKGKVQTMIASGLRYRSHATHSLIPETIELFNRLEVKRGIITHLNHEVDFDEVSAGLPENVELAWDGMVVDVN